MPFGRSQGRAVRRARTSIRPATSNREAMAARSASRPGVSGSTCDCASPAVTSAAAISRPTATPGLTSPRRATPSSDRTSPTTPGHGAGSTRSRSERGVNARWSASDKLDTSRQIVLLGASASLSSRCPDQLLDTETRLARIARRPRAPHQMTRPSARATARLVARPTNPTARATAQPGIVSRSRSRPM